MKSKLENWMKFMILALVLLLPVRLVDMLACGIVVEIHNWLHNHGGFYKGEIETGPEGVVTITFVLGYSMYHINKLYDKIEEQNKPKEP